jgi:predicted nucleotidyltransferase
MKKLLYLIILSSFQLYADENISMANKELSQEIEKLYQEWKTKENITPAKENALKYTLSITGPAIVGEYTMNGKTMLQVKKRLEEVLDGSHANQWYVAQIDSIDDSNYGIPAHTIAVVGLTLEQIENLASLIPGLKADLDRTKNGNGAIL